MKRIIVLGKNRSGTKYLTNLIAKNFDLSCVQHSDHNGVIESNIYCNYIKLFGFEPTPDSKNAILQLFQGDALFVNSLVKRDDLFSLKWDNLLGFQTAFFDKNAENQRKMGWVHKAESLSSRLFCSKEIEKVFIERKPEDVFLSSMKLGDFSAFQSLLILIKILFSSKIESYYARKYHAITVNYEDLLISPEAVLSKICDHCELVGIDELLESKENNSSFKNEGKKKIGRSVKGQVLFVKYIFNMLPIFAVLWLNKIYLNKNFQGFIRKTIVDPRMIADD